MGITLAIIASCILGISNIFLKKSYKDLSPSISFFLFSLLSVIFWVPFGLLMHVQFTHILDGIFVGLFSAIFGQLAWIYILSKGELSITATILATFPIYTILFSVIFNNEHITLLQILFISLNIIGILIVCAPKTFNKKELKKIHLIIWAVLGAMAVGSSDALCKNFINKTSVGTFYFYVPFMQLLVSFIYLKLTKEKLFQFKDVLMKFADYKFAFFGSLTLVIATMLFFLSFGFIQASIASPISATYPIVTIILALLFLKERISKKNIFGIIVVIVSIIVIGFLNKT